MRNYLKIGLLSFFLLFTACDFFNDTAKTQIVLNATLDVVEQETKWLEPKEYKINLPDRFSVKGDTLFVNRDVVDAFVFANTEGLSASIKINKKALKDTFSALIKEKFKSLTVSVALEMLDAESDLFRAQSYSLNRSSIPGINEIFKFKDIASVSLKHQDNALFVGVKFNKEAIASKLVDVLKTVNERIKNAQK
jgi:hypothetical protein